MVAPHNHSDHLFLVSDPHLQHTLPHGTTNSVPNLLELNAFYSPNSCKMELKQIETLDL